MPYLRLMSEGELVDQVWLVTVERGGDPVIAGLNELHGVHHVTIPMRTLVNGPLTKAWLFIRLILRLRRSIREHRIDVLDSKGALAGGVAYLMERLTHVRYIVESFEPHSEYMVDSGTWSRKGLYYRISSWLERGQRRTARFLITVTGNYARHLIAQGLPPERVKVIPSVTDLEMFRFNMDTRARVRSELGWEGSIIGVYVGKFGGLYYDEEAFAIFKRARDIFGDTFRLILITRDPMDHIQQRLKEIGFEPGMVLVRAEDHERVPQWLSAADFAFSTIRYAPHGLYQSPVKNGEYWANGLPIFLCTGVSDDFLLIRDNPWAGALFDLSKEGDVDKALHHMKDLVEQGVRRDLIMDLARQQRSIDIARKVYADVFATLLRECRP